MADDFPTVNIEQEFQNALGPSAQNPAPQAAAPSVNPVSAPEQAGAAAINVINPEGNLVSIPHTSLQDALDGGYQVASPDQVDQHFKEEQYGTPLEQFKTGLEGAAQAATFGLSTGIETGLGVNPEAIRARKEVNPGSAMAGQAAGLIGSAFIPGVGAAGLMEKAGAAGVEALGLGAAETGLAKIGSAATKAAIENAVFQGGDEVAKMLAKDPDQSVGSAMADIGLSGLIGGGIGGVLGAANPLWKATMGGKTDGVLKAVANKFGGIDGVVPDHISQAIDAAGLTDHIAPEIRASLSADPQIRELASVLRQTDTNASGKAFQEAESNFRARASEIQAEALGANPNELISKGEIDRYGAGKEVGETLAKEIETQVKPLSEGYDAFKNRFKSVELEPSVADKAEELSKSENKAFEQLQKSQKDLQKAIKANDAEGAIKAQNTMAQAESALNNVRKAKATPGTVDDLAEKLMNKAQQENWTLSPSSDIMKEVNRVVKELPNLKTLNQLEGYIRQVGENTASKLPFGQQDPVSRAGMIIKGILRDAEGDLLAKHIGEKEGAEALGAYKQLQKAYSDASKLKDQVADTLGLRASTSGYAKALRAMAANDGEKIIQRLSGKSDAAWLNLVQQRFPETAKLLKEHTVNELIAKSTKDGVLSSAKLNSALDSMSPQLRNFAVPPEALAKVKAANSLLNALNDSTHNFSNTARTVDKLLGHIPETMIGTITALASHNPITGGLAGMLTKTIGKDIPDAVRYGLLQFLGSSKAIDSEGFKSMVDFIHHTIKGENLISTASKNVFKAGRAVLPESQMPDQRDRDRLDKRLKTLQTDQKSMFDIGSKTAHYMPQAGQAMASTAANAVGYLNSIRPTSTKAAPLDKAMPPSAADKDKFNRALDIAQQPLSVLHHVQDGTLQVQDLAHLKAIYPQLYPKIAAKLTEAMSDMVEKGDSIPYKARMSLSLFLSQPMDSTMTPSSIIAAQPKPESPGPQQQGAPMQHAKHSMTALNKLPASYQTATQARQSAREGRNA